MIKQKVERSTAALEGVVKFLDRPGVDIRAKKDVPLYSVAEGEPGVFIRRLNGRVNRGRLVNGAFEVSIDRSFRGRRADLGGPAEFLKATSEL